MQRFVFLFFKINILDIISIILKEGIHKWTLRSDIYTNIRKYTGIWSEKYITHMYDYDHIICMIMITIRKYTGTGVLIQLYSIPIKMTIIQNVIQIITIIMLQRLTWIYRVRCSQSIVGYLPNHTGISIVIKNGRSGRSGWCAWCAFLFETDESNSSRSDKWTLRSELD